MTTLKMQESPTPGVFQAAGRVEIDDKGALRPVDTPKDLTELLKTLVPKKWWDGPPVPADDPKYAEAVADEIERTSDWRFTVDEIVKS